MLSRLELSVNFEVGAMLVRVRSRFGTWRLTNVEARTKVGELMARIEDEHGVKLSEQELRTQPGKKSDPLRAATRGELSIKHGSLIYLEVTSGATATAADHTEGGSTKKRVDANGNLISSAREVESKAFRPGALSLDPRKCTGR